MKSPKEEKEKISKRWPSMPMTKIQKQIMRKCERIKCERVSQSFRNVTKITK